MPFFPPIQRGSDTGTIHRFTNRHFISAGSYGTIYRACDSLTGDLVALKQYKITSRFEGDAFIPTISDESQNYMREIMIAKLLGSHPHIVQFLGSFIESQNGMAYIVMPYYEHCLSACFTTLSLYERLYVMNDITGALIYMHDRGVIHRDVKMDNIMFGSNKRAKLIDFSLSTCASKRTSKYYTLSPYIYKPMDAFFGNQFYGTETDSWSWGIVCLELITDNFFYTAAFDAIETRFPSHSPPHVPIYKRNLAPVLRDIDTRALRTQNISDRNLAVLALIIKVFGVPPSNVLNRFAYAFPIACGHGSSSTVMTCQQLMRSLFRYIEPCEYFPETSPMRAVLPGYAPYFLALSTIASHYEFPYIFGNTDPIDDAAPIMDQFISGLLCIDPNLRNPLKTQK